MMMRIHVCDGESDEVVKRRRKWRWKWKSQRKQISRANQQQAALSNVAEGIEFGDGEVDSETTYSSTIGSASAEASQCARSILFRFSH